MLVRTSGADSEVRRGVELDGAGTDRWGELETQQVKGRLGRTAMPARGDRDVGLVGGARNGEEDVDLHGKYAGDGKVAEDCNGAKPRCDRGVRKRGARGAGEVDGRTARCMQMQEAAVPATAREAGGEKKEERKIGRAHV